MYVRSPICQPLFLHKLIIVQSPPPVPKTGTSGVWDYLTTCHANSVCVHLTWLPEDMLPFKWCTYVFGGISFPLASLLCYRSTCLIQITSVISLSTLTCCMSQKTTWIGVLSRLFLGGAAPAIVQIYSTPYQCFRGCCTPHKKSHGMRSQSVFNSYYQTVTRMQVHSNQLHNSDARGRWGLDLILVF